jgi:uncharacterized protein
MRVGNAQLCRVRGRRPVAGAQAASGSSAGVGVQADTAGIIQNVVEWARAQAGLVALGLVGSHARGAAREDSDLDFLLLVEAPGSYLADMRWVSAFGFPARTRVETWGKVTSLRVWYAEGPEVEFGLAPLDWGSKPADPGDAEVVGEGIVVLFERDEILSERVRAFTTGAGPMRS